MKKKGFITVVTGILAGLALPLLGGCGQQVNAETGGQPQGGIIMAGSTSMEKLSNELAESYMEKNPNARISAEFTGSSAGIEALLNKTVQIGNSSRELKQEEIDQGAVENIIAIDGIAVIVNQASSVTGLASEEVRSVFDGTVKNWAELGGGDSEIVVIGREAGSGTRDAFEEILSLKGDCSYSNELDSTGAVVAKVAATPGAIGYVSLDVLDDSVLALEIDGAKAEAESIKDGSYQLCRPFVMATLGSIEEQEEGVQDFFAFIRSEEGQRVIEAVGLIVPKA